MQLKQTRDRDELGNKLEANQMLPTTTYRCPVDPNSPRKQWLSSGFSNLQTSAINKLALSAWVASYRTPARNHILGSILYYPKKRVSRCCPRYVLVVTVTRMALFLIPPSTTLKWLSRVVVGVEDGILLAWDRRFAGTSRPFNPHYCSCPSTIRWTTKVVLYRVPAFHVLYFCIDVEPSPPTARERLRACLLPTHFRESTYLRGRIPACDERANWPADISMSSRKEGARE